MDVFSFGPNRYLCDVLDEMRTCVKTLNFRPLDSLIEETQILANRMESALGDKRDIKRYHQMIKELKKEIVKLEAKKKEAAK